MGGTMPAGTVGDTGTQPAVPTAAVLEQPHAVDSSSPVIEATRRPRIRRARSASLPSSLTAPSTSALSLSLPAPSSSPRFVARPIADPLKPGSPPLRAVQPPRRDIRKSYLTNLGMKRAVVAGPGGTRTPPPMVRRSSFHHGVRKGERERGYNAWVVGLHSSSSSGSLGLLFSFFCVRVYGAIMNSF